ncbi:MAG: 4Fe-4S binding protein [Planctomycetota bacterium]
MTRRRRRIPPWFGAAVAGMVLLAAGLWRGEMETVRRTSTYRDFDVPSEQSGVQYLSPGVPDRAHEGSYTFGGPVHATPLIALGIVFLVFFLLRNVGSLDVRLRIRRGLTQWLAFVAARLGVFRVAGAVPVGRCAAGVFPFLNCQACEMATGACPVGQFQTALLARRLPLLALGTVVLTAALLGRWICGWLCPFGLFSDILDRISLRRFRPAHIWRVGGYVVLVFLVAGSVVFAWAGITGEAPFCSTVCMSGKLYGLLPYYATTAAPDVAGPGSSAGVPLLVWHALLFVIFLVAAILVSGRVFCRYLCPMGAMLGLANRIAAVKVVHRAEACNGCDRCHETCPMGIDLARPDFLTQSACIRCGRCISVCAQGARGWEFPWSSVRERSPRHAPVPAPRAPVPQS